MGSGRMDGWMSGGWMDGQWEVGWVDRWMDEQVDG